MMRALSMPFFFCVIGLVATSAVAWDGDIPKTSRRVANEAPPTIIDSDRLGQAVFQPCFGAGYLPYAYPAFETCPCGSDGCFHPAWYYCGGKPYRQQWLRKWVRAHLGNGSMLEGYSCPCIFPTTGRAYVPSNADLRDQLEDETGLPPDGPIPAE